MDLNEIREQIDTIDDELLKLFEKRMELVTSVAEYKKANNLPIFNSKRERDIVSRLTAGKDNVNARYISSLFSSMFEVSRSYQNYLLFPGNRYDEIRDKHIIDAHLFPENATVACAGVEGANAQFACERIFKRPQIMYTNNFQAVFSAVDSGLCRYGILPIENSLQGSVTEVYDLMKQYNFSIVRSVKLKIDHSLLALPGTKLENIKNVYSHPQALSQCSKYLAELKNASKIPCENTAIAAERLRTLGSNENAAVASSKCAQLYGLEVLKSHIQNDNNNYTRFICISKTPEVYTGANKISLMLALPHTPGSLHQIISAFSVFGMNIVKLESRPIPGTDFEFMFYIDVEADIHSDGVTQILSELDKKLDYFAFLGNYAEV